jgi:hypothetical protein
LEKENEKIRQGCGKPPVAIAKLINIPMEEEIYYRFLLVGAAAPTNPARGWVPPDPTITASRYLHEMHLGIADHPS